MCGFCRLLRHRVTCTIQFLYRLLCHWLPVSVFCLLLFVWLNV